MARIVTFSDSFESATEPSIEGLVQENYTILNNATDESILTIDSSVYKSAFIDFELKRSDETDSFIETGSLQLIYDGSSWNYAKNISINSELLVTSLENPEHVVLSFQTTDGVGELKYTSGNMGSSYEGTLKISIVRIAAT